MMIHAVKKRQPEIQELKNEMARLKELLEKEKPVPWWRKLFLK
jgi:hypothetical protein